MSSAARKPTTTDDPPDTPALAAAPKTRQRHDPKDKAQAELDRADARVTTLDATIAKHEAALGVAIGKHRHALQVAKRDHLLARQHRDYLAMHPLLVAPEGTAQNPLPEPDDEGDDPSRSRR